MTTTRVDGIEQLLVTYPDVVAGGYTVVPGDGTAHFGLAMSQEPKVCTQGYGGTHRTDPNRTTNLPPVNTGHGCTLPRGSASAVRGSQNAPGPSSPGYSSSSVPRQSAASPYPRAPLRRWAWQHPTSRCPSRHREVSRASRRGCGS